MKSRDDKPPRAWNSTIAQRSKPMNRGPGPKRSARLASEIAPSRKPVRRKKRTASEYARIYGSRERVRFVKALGCVYCAALSPLFAICRAGESENAHTVTGGMGRKADYDTIVPLCPSHHKMFDQHRGPLADEAARDAIKAVAPAIEQLWQAALRGSPPNARNRKMTHLSDVFDLDLLAHCLAERLVVARRHPHCDLTILNYTERCQYERDNWNPVTLACRGLIHDGNGEIVARPFRKFFNYGQSEAGALDLGARCIATDKLDGSLGILYRAGDEWSIATRGAFESEQARHATELYRREYASRFLPPDGWTLLFEIVYPENRIVLDYGGRDDLILLGGVDIATGRSRGTGYPALCGWPGPCAEKFGYATVADALAAEPRANAEGLVLHLIDSDERVKIKQEDYVALHRIVTGLNERTVWEHLKNGGAVVDLCGNLPDEFHGWVDEVAARLVATVERNAAEVETAYSTILATLPAEFTRKDFALAAKNTPWMTHLFSRHDGKDYRGKLWDAAMPAPRIGPRAIPDEVAACPLLPESQV